MAYTMAEAEAEARAMAEAEAMAREMTETDEASAAELAAARELSQAAAWAMGAGNLQCLLGAVVGFHSQLLTLGMPVLFCLFVVWVCLSFCWQGYFVDFFKPARARNILEFW